MKLSHSFQARIAVALVALLMAVVGALVSVLAQVRVHRVRDEHQAHRAIAPVVYAFVLTVTGIAAARRPAWAVPLVLYYLAFVLTMQRRPVRAQI